MPRLKKSKSEKTEKILKPVRPNLGLQIEFRNRLFSLIDSMNKNVQSEIANTYKKNTPEITLLAKDESPASAIKKLTQKLIAKWIKRFDDAAPRLAKYFSTSIQKRSDATLKKILKDGGFSVEWRMSRAMNDAMQATINEQVSLIKSIPSQYFTQIEGMVMRSVTTGRDLKQLTDDLQKQFGVTRRRAEFIARDQNNKATATLTKVRQMSAMGPDAIAIWVHSGGGRDPRKTHLKAGRERIRFKVAEGWHDPDPKVNKPIWPGTLINCRCISRLVVPGFS